MQAKDLSVDEAKKEVERLRSIKINSKEEINKGLTVFDNILEVNTAIRTKYIEQAEDKFKIPAMQALDAQNPNLHLQQELDRQMKIISTSRRELEGLQNKQDNSKETKEKEKAVPKVVIDPEKRKQELGNLIDEAVNKEKELRKLLEEEQTKIAQSRKADFKFSHIAKEAFGPAVSTDRAQGVGFARGQAENDAMNGVKDINTPIGALAKEFVDVYSFVSQWTTLRAALKDSVTSLNLARKDTSGAREDKIEVSVIKLNSLIHHAQKHIVKTHQAINSLKNKLGNSIPTLQREYKDLDTAIVAAARSGGRVKVSVDDQKRFMELHTLLETSRVLQKIVNGLNIDGDKTLAKASLSSPAASSLASSVSQSHQSAPSPSSSSSDPHPPILRATQQGYLSNPHSPAQVPPAPSASQPPHPQTPSPRKRS